MALIISVVLTCHVWQGIRYCDGPHNYRTEEHVTGGIIYGRDNAGKRWEGRVYNDQEYWRTWQEH